jgi:hypothetical protein
MKILLSLLSIVLWATSLVAQDAPIPQDLPSQLRQNSDAVRRRVEQPIPRNLPWRQPTKWLDQKSFFNSARTTNGQTPATEKVNTGTVEDRIAALEAKVEALRSELEAQTALIKQLQELLQRQEKKN